MRTGPPIRIHVSGLGAAQFSAHRRRGAAGRALSVEPHGHHAHPGLRRRALRRAVRAAAWERPPDSAHSQRPAPVARCPQGARVSWVVSDVFDVRFSPTVKKWA